MNKHIRPMEFDEIVESFSSDACRSELEKKARRKRISAVVAIGVLVIGAGYALHRLATPLSAAINNPVHYVDSFESALAGPNVAFPFMPFPTDAELAARAAADARIQHAKEDLHRTVQQFQAEQGDFLKRIETGAQAPTSFGDTFLPISGRCF